jgi:hypothetical protein
MSRRCIRTLIACAAWLPATAALATQEPPKVQMKPAAPESTAPTVQAVVVEATQPAELRKQTFNYVQSFAARSPKIDQVTRWSHPICVSTDGVAADKAAQVKGRVEEVAKALGLRVGGKDCNPNIEIFFTQQPQAYLDKVANAEPALLGYGFRNDRALRTVTRPIQAWYVTATVGSGNTTGTAFGNIAGGLASSSSSAGAGGSANGEIVDDPGSGSPTGCGDSRFGGCLKSIFEHVMVVVDLSKVQDRSTGLLADYAVMLTLSQPRSLDACNGLVSVVDLFSSTCGGRPAPDGLTRADVSYLTSLYKADAEARTSSQQTDIATRMADMLLKANKLDRLAVDGGVKKTSSGQ